MQLRKTIFQNNLNFNKNIFDSLNEMNIMHNDKDIQKICLDTIERS